MASLSQGRTAAAQCGLFTHKSVPVIFEPPCIRKVNEKSSGNCDDFNFTEGYTVLVSPAPKTFYG